MVSLCVSFVFCSRRRQHPRWRCAVSAQYRISNKISDDKDRALAEYKTQAEKKLAAVNNEAAAANKRAAEADQKAAELNRETAELKIIRRPD
ncbi:MAG: hypothetical protein CPDRYMAC_3201 [uncultured Paraburkholderia sp.]|nr:MAG: hypothetical protein CPDRYDRY_3108 [uncultured Paraburkholderia sp.]CAH2929613.1 MAG: hypothetical protein CPDRYMAC_3201 [uncultured Paraburkholderia sp.]